MTLLYDLIMIIDTRFVPTKKYVANFQKFFSRQENVAAAKVDGSDSEQHTFLLHGFVNRTLRAYLHIAQISDQNAQHLLYYFMDLRSAFIIIVIIIIVFYFREAHNILWARQLSRYSELLRAGGPETNPGGSENFRPFRPALGPTQPPVKWVPGLSRG